MTGDSSSRFSPPPPVAEWMERYGEGAIADFSHEELVDGAIRALREAISRPGRDREAAYALLAADGLLTLAVERGVATSDPWADPRPDPRPDPRNGFAKLEEAISGLVREELS